MSKYLNIIWNKLLRLKKKKVLSHEYKDLNDKAKTQRNNAFQIKKEKSIRLPRMFYKAVMLRTFHVTKRKEIHVTDTRLRCKTNDA